jgi:hypothetical protein
LATSRARSLATPGGAFNAPGIFVFFWPPLRDIIDATEDSRMDDALDEETLDAIDQAEDQIDRGDVYAWEDVREQVRLAFLRNSSDLRA